MHLCLYVCDVCKDWVLRDSHDSGRRIITMMYSALSGCMLICFGISLTDNMCYMFSVLPCFRLLKELG